jgi:hypothetical protein
MKTRHGIYYNLKESEYRFKIGEVAFYFSSELNRKKFMKSYLDEFSRFNESLMRIYKNKFEISLPFLAWIRLYTLIEKRGFYLELEGEPVECLENLVFAETLNLRKKYEN